MEYNGEVRTAEELSGEARGAADAVEAADALTEYLPSVETYDLDYDLEAGAAGLPRAASFRAYNATAPYGSDVSTGSKKGSLPASSIAYRLDELDKLRLRQASNEAEAAEMERKARLAGQSIAIRAILARGQSIDTGKVTLQGENGIITEITFGRRPELSPVASVLWNNTAAPIHSDIVAWQAQRRALGLAPASGAILSSDVIAAMSTNDEMISAAMRRGDSGITRINRNDILSVLAGEGITDVLIYDQVYADSEGVQRRPIRANRFILGPSRDTVTLGEGGPLGQTRWGVPAEALNEKFAMSEGDAPGIFAARFDGHNPERSEITASSIFLPVLERYNDTTSAQVLA